MTQRIECRICHKDITANEEGTLEFAQIVVEHHWIDKDGMSDNGGAHKLLTVCRPCAETVWDSVESHFIGI